MISFGWLTSIQTKVQDLCGITVGSAAISVVLAVALVSELFGVFPNALNVSSVMMAMMKNVLRIMLFLLLPRCFCDPGAGPRENAAPAPSSHSCTLLPVLTSEPKKKSCSQ